MNFFEIRTFEAHCDSCDRSVRIEKAVPAYVIPDAIYLKPEIDQLGWQCRLYEDHKGRPIRTCLTQTKIRCPEHVLDEPTRDAPRARRRFPGRSYKTHPDNNGATHE